MNPDLPVWGQFDFHQFQHEHGVEHTHEDMRRLGSPEFMLFAASGRHPGVGQILRHLSWVDEPEDLQPIVGRLAETAIWMLSIIPDGPETTAGLRKLVEAKDCFLRAAKE